MIPQIAMVVMLNVTLCIVFQGNSFFPGQIITAWANYFIIIISICTLGDYGTIVSDDVIGQIVYRLKICNLRLCVHDKTLFRLNKSQLLLITIAILNSTNSTQTSSNLGFIWKLVTRCWVNVQNLQAIDLNILWFVEC